MAKGGAFENEIAKAYSLWWSNGNRDDIFYRTGGSGSRFTFRGKRGKTTENAAGDMGYTDSEGKPFIDFALHEFKTGYTSLAPIKKADVDKICKSSTAKAMDATLRKIFSGKKRSNTIDVLDIVDSNAKEPLIVGWIQKAEKERTEAGRKVIMIVMRRFMKTPILLMPGHLLGSIERYNGEWKQDFIIIRINDAVYFVLSFRVFLEWCSGETFKGFIGSKLIT